MSDRTNKGVAFRIWAQRRAVCELRIPLFERSRIGCQFGLFSIGVLIVLYLALAQANADVTQEIITRCRTQMQEYGSAMVKACVDQDIAALRSLNGYPTEHQAIVSRCYWQMKDYGYVMVKACADQDIQAEEALKTY